MLRSISVFLGAYACFFFLWVLMLTFAGHDNFVTPEQMQSHGLGFQKGIPWDGHVGIKYLDLLPFPMLMALWVAMYGDSWTKDQISGCAIAGLTLSALMHVTYIMAGKHFPEFVTYGGKLTAAGWTHFWYMSIGFTIVFLIYTSTTNPAPWLLCLTSAYLVVHVALGTHIIYKIWTPTWFPYHGVDASTLAPILVGAVILAGASWWALR